jgi:putative addiction module component (TIGR02574 family)
MEKRRDEVAADALRMPPYERAQLAEALIESLDEDAEVIRAWADEVARHIEAVRAGRAEPMLAGMAAADDGPDA